MSVNMVDAHTINGRRIEARLRELPLRGHGSVDMESRETKPGHVVLLGDSIFDNGVYVPGEPDVVCQLREALGAGWRASLLAVDGAVTSDVASQLRRLPDDASLIVVSVGGNDALGASALLASGTSSVGEALLMLAGEQNSFAARYEAMVETVLEAGRPTAFCTIYDANYPDPEGQAIRAGLALFNDIITRAAFRRGCSLIDLRLICDEPADYANPIEPSARGGRKIAEAIARLAKVPQGGALSRVLAN
jgi:lysophospholipase L1-like esterase